jgi:myo-inositol-1-phosphate synthase
MGRIKVAIAGVGNCASALVQGIHHYSARPAGDGVGLMHRNIGGYTPDAIDVVAAFDIDRRKVGKDVSEAIFSLPNCTTVFCPDIPLLNTPVLMGPILDGVSDHMLDYDPKRSFLPADLPQLDKAAVVRQLKGERD